MNTGSRSTTVIAGPFYPVITLDQAKAHLREESDDFDTYIEAIIAAATALLDGPNGWLGKSLMTQTMELRMGEFPCGREIQLPFGPIQYVNSIIYVGSDGTDQVIDDTTYSLYGDIIVLQSGQSWPRVCGPSNGIRIQFDGGYPDADSVPTPLKQAILLLIGHLYANRDAVSDAQKYDLPLAVQALVSPYRAFSV